MLIIVSNTVILITMISDSDLKQGVKFCLTVELDFHVSLRKLSIITDIVRDNWDTSLMHRDWGKACESLMQQLIQIPLFLYV